MFYFLEVALSFSERKGVPCVSATVKRDCQDVHSYLLALRGVLLNCLATTL